MNGPPERNDPQDRASTVKYGRQARSSPYIWADNYVYNLGRMLSGSMFRFVQGLALLVTSNIRFASEVRIPVKIITVKFSKNKLPLLATTANTTWPKPSRSMPSPYDIRSGRASLQSRISRIIYRILPLAPNLAFCLRTRTCSLCHTTAALGSEPCFRTCIPLPHVLALGPNIVPVTLLSKLVGGGLPNWKEALAARTRLWYCSAREKLPRCGLL